MDKIISLLVRALGTLYLLEAPLLLWLRMLVLMFVPSKSAWTDDFHGMHYRTWNLVLLAAVVGFLMAGIACWVQGLRLARQPGAWHGWRLLVSLLVIGHLAWLSWVLLSNDRLWPFHLGPALAVVGLAIHAWRRPSTLASAG